MAACFWARSSTGQIINVEQISMTLLITSFILYSFIETYIKHITTHYRAHMIVHIICRIRYNASNLICTKHTTWPSFLKSIQDGLSSKFKKNYVPLYFIATKYFEEYINNWTLSYSLAIIYWNNWSVLSILIPKT